MCDSTGILKAIEDAALLAEDKKAPGARKNLGFFLNQFVGKISRLRETCMQFSDHFYSQ